MWNILAQVSLWGGVLAVLMVGLPGPLHKFGVVPVEMGLGGMAIGGLIGLVVAAIALVVLISRFMGANVGLGTAALGFALSGGAAFFVLSFLMEARSVPSIHDITTDTSNPPEFVAVAALRGGGDHPAAYDGPEVAALQTAHYVDLQPLNTSQSPSDVFAAALAVVEAQGWTLVEASESEGRIEASDHTFWWGFTDDVVIRIVADGTGSRVDLRSKSRVGQSDVGANAARIDEYLDALEARLGN